MSKMEIVEKEIRTFHKSWLAKYVAKAIEIYNRIYIDEDIGSYQQIYNSCLDELTIRDVEKWKREINNKELATRTKNDLFEY